MTTSDTRIGGPGPAQPGDDADVHELGISSDLSELANVRTWVRTVLRGFPGPVVTTAVMVVDELTSNALRHGHGPHHLRLWPGADRVRIEVDDGDGEPARRREPSDRGGRGLLLVERCAVRWGQTPRPDGKTLWAELSTDPGAHV